MNKDPKVTIRTPINSLHIPYSTFTKNIEPKTQHITIFCYFVQMCQLKT